MKRTQASYNVCFADDDVSETEQFYLALPKNGFDFIFRHFPPFHRQTFANRLKWNELSVLNIMREIMSVLFRFALVCDLILLLLEKFVPELALYLPIGGDHIVQVGILLLVAAIFHETIDAFRR